MSTDDEDLGDAIRRACKGTTLEAVSLSLGLSKNQLSRWAAGKTEPRAESYALLMEFLGVNLTRLGALIARMALRRAGLNVPQ